MTNQNTSVFLFTRARGTHKHTSPRSTRSSGDISHSPSSDLVQVCKRSGCSVSRLALCRSGSARSLVTANDSREGTGTTTSFPEQCEELQRAKEDVDAHAASMHATETRCVGSVLTTLVGLDADVSSCSRQSRPRLRARHPTSTSTQRGDEASESGGGDTGDACEARDVDAMDLASELCSDRRSVGGRLFTGHAEVTAVNVSNQDARGVHATRRVLL